MENRYKYRSGKIVVDEDEKRFFKCLIVFILAFWGHLFFIYPLFKEWGWVRVVVTGTGRLARVVETPVLVYFTVIIFLVVGFIFFSVVKPGKNMGGC